VPRAPRNALRPDECRIAGSGSNLPLVRRLAAAYRAHHPTDPIVIHDSIGSSGGLRAVADGVVHLGAISRPLRADEERAGIRAIPQAAVPVVLGAHPGVPDASLSSQALASLVRGREVRWSNGARAVLLEREASDSSYKVLYARSAPFRASLRAVTGRTHWRVLLHDSEMVEALAGTPGAVGLADLGVLRLSGRGLRVVRIDGLDPAAPDYPYLKELAFVVRGTPAGVTARFLAFTRGDEARAIAVAAGYRPRT